MSGKLRFSDIPWRRWAAIAAICNLIIALPLAAQETGTFVDRLAPIDLRVVSYNIYFDSIFPETNAERAAKFARVMNALNPDIINLQEIYSHTGANVAGLMNSILPLGGGATWYAHRAGDNVIVSKYPMSLHRSNTIPASPRNIAIALVNLPDAQFQTDFYFMNNHFRCCGAFPGGPEDMERQRQADALVNWMRDARTAGGNVDLSTGTPMAVVGDLNIVESLDPLNNLIAGNIVNEATYGADSPPDWDGTSLGDAHPRHNVAGPADYTWRDDDSIFEPGRLDFVLYTDSVARIAHQFVLNTVDMSPAEFTATGLQTYDVTIDASTYDHLPLVIDFRFPADYKPGDYDLDRSVEVQDQELWQQTYGSTFNLDADGSRNSVVDAADYVVWRKFDGASYASSGSNGSPVPEPASNLLLILLLVFARNRCCATGRYERADAFIQPAS